MTDSTRTELFAFIAAQQRAIIAAADKILSAGADPPIQTEIQTTALREKLAALWMLVKVGDKQALGEAVRVSGGLRGDKRKELADRAEFFLLWARLQRAIPDGGENFDAKQTAELAADVERQLEQGNADELLVILASKLPDDIEPVDPRLALAVSQKLATAFARRPDPAVRRTAAHLIGVAKRLGLVGQTLEIEGRLVDGSTLDWRSFRGRVVLVDFWAVWCQPCVAEIPNVKNTYDTFHERGFGVVGINLDEDRTQLAKFLKDNDIPWATLRGTSAADSGMRHPMVVKYGVESVRRNFLVDQDGKVVANDVHGERLPKLVESLLGARGSAKTPGGK